MDQDISFMRLAKEIGQLSTDRSTKVGAVIVDENSFVLTTGCNGFPKGISEDVEYRHERPTKYLWTEHAERNAIYEAARTGVALSGGTMYLPWFPCMDCARAIVQCGIRRLVANAPDFSDPTWGTHFRAAIELLNEAGVQVDFSEERSGRL